MADLRLSGRFNLFLGQFFPVNVGKEWMVFDFLCILSGMSYSLLRLVNLRSNFYFSYINLKELLK